MLASGRGRMETNGDKCVVVNIREYIYSLNTDQPSAGPYPPVMLLPRLHMIDYPIRPFPTLSLLFLRIEIALSFREGCCSTPTSTSGFKGATGYS